MNRSGEPAPRELNTSYGHGMTVYGPFCVRYVVVPPDSELLPKGEQVTRYDDDTLLVAADIPTKSVGGKPDKLTEKMHTFLHDDLEARGLLPEFRQTSVTEREVIERMESDDQ